MIEFNGQVEQIEGFYSRPVSKDRNIRSKIFTIVSDPHQAGYKRDVVTRVNNDCVLASPSQRDKVIRVYL